MKATLLLEDGSRFEGEAFGAVGAVVGEVVFQTGMTGYQEVLTDPSYCQQLVVMTYPLIGNCGINKEDFESTRPACQALIVREWAKFPSHWQMSWDLNQYLKQTGVLGLSGIDTRSLTRRLREKGTMKGLLASGTDAPLVLQQAGKWLNGELPRDQVSRVSVQEKKTYFSYQEGVPNGSLPVGKERVNTPSNPKALHVVLFDFGAKRNIVQELLNRSLRVTQVPYDTPVSVIETLKPDGVVLSNGPGDPQDLPQVLPVIRRLIQAYPLFGICLGHQLLALACGAKTGKMKFGHRGANQPVQEVASGKAWITSQNHGYTVLEASLKETSLEVTYRSLNDGTVEGLRHLTYPAFSVQFHPEAAPGPADTRFLFDQFIQLMQQEKGVFAHA